MRTKMLLHSKCHRLHELTVGLRCVVDSSTPRRQMATVCWSLNPITRRVNAAIQCNMLHDFQTQMWHGLGMRRGSV